MSLGPSMPYPPSLSLSSTPSLVLLGITSKHPGPCFRLRFWGRGQTKTVSPTVRPSSSSGRATAWGECHVEQCRRAGTSVHRPSQPEQTRERPRPAGRLWVHKAGMCGERELVQGAVRGVGDGRMEPAVESGLLCECVASLFNLSSVTHAFLSHCRLLLRW